MALNLAEKRIFAGVLIVLAIIVGNSATLPVENVRQCGAYGVEWEHVTVSRRVTASVRWRRREVTRGKDFDDAHGGAASRTE